MSFEQKLVLFSTISEYIWKIYLNRIMYIYIWKNIVSTYLVLKKKKLSSSAKCICYDGSIGTRQRKGSSLFSRKDWTYFVGWLLDTLPWPEPWWEAVAADWQRISPLHLSEDGQASCASCIPFACRYLEYKCIFWTLSRKTRNWSIQKFQALTWIEVTKPTKVVEL